MPKPMGMGGRRGGAMPKDMKADMKSLSRTLKKFFQYYPVLAPVVVVCILVASIVSAMPAIFVQKITAIIEKYVESRDWVNAWIELKPSLFMLIGLYLLSLVAIVVQTQLMAYMTQGFLDKFRKEMFDGMQDLPIKYFDQNQHGDIMSHYTNDIDTLRMFVSQTFPTLIQSGCVVLMCLAEMLYFSFWLTLIVLAGIVVMILFTSTVGKGSSKYFMSQQRAVAKTEGYVQETMNGQKVVKVFCHEDQAMEDFNKVNDAWAEESTKAHAYANILGPVIQNIGNILYVSLALIGGILIAKHAGNMGFRNIFMNAGLVENDPLALFITVDILIPFLQMAKQFTGNFNTLTQQMGTIVMASAGAARVYELIDEQPEADAGYVTLVNANVLPDGTIEESDKPTGKWAWRHPHQADGTVTYTMLQGDVEMKEVDFEYEEGKQVLFDVSVFAKPGQKVAFVGATGAGKTTITNLINRFYDIADGKIRYDGININKIKKSDLRKSLGIVLQETNLFTGSVMDNIRYGRLEASDEECIEAAKLAGADNFITRLPEGYNTLLSNNGSNLSQGQRQLIAIARAAVANPPVMILDEATSSIDTRTEAIVQRGMDKLMEGRTVFVIAHRLSTVMNSDVIMVLDHGRIIERGTHKELIDKQGVYYQLYTGAFELE